MLPVCSLKHAGLPLIQHTPEDLLLHPVWLSVFSKDKLHALA